MQREVINRIAKKIINPNGYPIAGLAMESKVKRDLKHYNVGKNNPMYGRRHRLESIEKMRLANIGENHYNWKGDKVSYNALHTWINKEMPRPELCEMCKQRPPYDAACITGIYNHDFKNWKYICRFCHRSLDRRVTKT